MAHVADPPDIDVAILFGKTESLGEIGADFVAVENLDTMPPLAQFLGDQISKRGFSRPGKTGKPQGKALIHLQKSNSRKNRLLGEPQKLLNLMQGYKAGADPRIQWAGVTPALSVPNRLRCRLFLARLPEQI